MAKFFEFKPTFGWSELIALIAAVVAGFALNSSYQANSPKISITPLPVRAHIVCPPSGNGGNRNVIAYIPLAITNTGGRATSFIGLKKTKDTHAIVANVYGDKKLEDFQGWLNIVDTNLKDTKILDEPSWEVDKRLENNKVMILTESSYGTSKPPVLNVSIPSGETVIAVIGFRSPWQSEVGQVYEYLVNMTAEFSNGQSRDLQFNVTPRSPGRVGRCP